jgi:hypothetical protein
MPIAIEVFNRDTRETAVVSVETRSPDGSELHGAIKHYLSGGASCAVYVNGLHQIVIQEVANGTWGS